MNSGRGFQFWLTAVASLFISEVITDHHWSEATSYAVVITVFLLGYLWATARNRKAKRDRAVYLVLYAFRNDEPGLSVIDIAFKAGVVPSMSLMEPFIQNGHVIVEVGVDKTGRDGSTYTPKLYRLSPAGVEHVDGPFSHPRVGKRMSPA